MQQARGDIGDLWWHEHEASHATHIFVHLQRSARPWLLAVRWVKALGAAEIMQYRCCLRKVHTSGAWTVRRMHVVPCSGGDQSEHSREMKARALQQVVDIIQRNQYQAAVTEVPFVDFTRGLSGKSSSNKQMLVF